LYSNLFPHEQDQTVKLAKLESAPAELPSLWSSWGAEDVSNPVLYQSEQNRDEQNHQNNHMHIMASNGDSVEGESKT